MSLKILLEKVYKHVSSDNTIESLKEDTQECICRFNYRDSYQFRISKNYNDEKLNIFDETEPEEDNDLKIDEYDMIPVMNVPIIYNLGSDILETDILEIKCFKLDKNIDSNFYYLSDM